jgi:hypothetical protein
MGQSIRAANGKELSTTVEETDTEYGNGLVETKEKKRR